MKTRILFNFMLILALIYSKISFAQTPVYKSRITENLKSPVRVAIDNSDILYVTDAFQKQIIKYDVSGNFIGSTAFEGSPVSIAISETNIIFVGDAETGYIFKINSNGTTSVFYSGTQFPNSMVFDSNGLLHVVDSKLKKVIVLNQSGSVVNTIGSGIFTFPTGIAFDKKNNRILITEHGGIGTGFNPVVKIWIFTSQGNLISSFGSHGNTDGKFYRIQGICVSRCGNIYVPDPFQGNVSVFNENGLFLTRFGNYGEGTGQLNLPLDIITDSHDRLLITSINNGAIEIFDINYLLPTSNILCTNKAICSGDVAEIPIHFTGTAPWNFTYTVNGVNPVEISGTTNNPYILYVADAGTYSVTALSDANSSGSCFSGKPTIAVTNAIPTVNIVSANVSICEGQTADITIDFTGNAPWNFTYTVNGLNPTQKNNIYESRYVLNVSESGIYEITSLSGGSCNGIGNVLIANVITNNASSTTANATICQGNSYTFGTQTLSQSGIYTETFATFHGCDSIVTLTLNVNPLNHIYKNESICEGNSFTFGEQSLSTTGIYSEVYEAVNGCDSIVTLNLSVYLPVVNLGADKEICVGNNIILNAGSLHVQYLWNNLTTNKFLTVNSSGVYSVTVTDENGCTNSDQINILIISNPKSSFSYNENNLEVVFSNNSLYATSFLWDFGDNTTSTEINPVHNYLTTGEYLVSLTATNTNCGNSFTSTPISIIEVQINEEIFQNSLQIYPNPSKGFITVESDKLIKSNFSIEIIDITGRVILSKIHDLQYTTEQIDLSAFSNGIYTIRIVSDKFMKIEQLCLLK